MTGPEIYNSLNSVSELLNAVTIRQKLASANIANAQTPGYTAKEASFSDLLRDANSPFETGLSRKMGTSMAANDATSTGETVNMQKELISMQKNMLFYSMATRRASSILTNLRTASQIGR